MAQLRINEYQVQGPLLALGQIWAVTRAELLMQWRRWGFWLAFGIATVLLLLLLGSSFAVAKQVFLADTVQGTVNSLIHLQLQLESWILAIIAGLLTSDRLSRDITLGLTDALWSTPLSSTSYVTGKFVGNLGSVLAPAFLSIMIGGTVFVLLGAPIALLSYLAVAFILVFVPTFALVVSFTLFFSSIVPLRLVQIGFPLIWMYCVLSPLGWKTIANTIFAADGRYVIGAFFFLNKYNNHPIYNSAEAWMNIIALLITALACLFLLGISISFQAKRRAAA